MIVNIFILIAIFILQIEGANNYRLISEKEKQLDRNNKQYKIINLKYSKAQKSILEYTKKNLKFQRETKIIEKKINSNKIKIKIIKFSINKIQKKYSKLQKEISIKKSKLLSLYSNNVGILLMMKRLNRATTESIILENIYNIESNENMKIIKRITKKISNLIKKKNNLSNQLSPLNKKVNKFRELKKKLSIKRKKYNRNLAVLKKKKKIYKRKLTRMAIEKKSLVKILKKLNITKSLVSTEIQNRNNSFFYSKNSIGTYKNKKTIAPIRNPVIIQKFGLYEDPIYKIKMFNRNIVFKINRRDTKIRNILDGKIVFINKKGMLNAVIIISHNKNIHTIYAKVSKINSSLHIGKKIHKGDFIGIANDKLIFEVTKNKKNINPEELIHL